MADVPARTPTRVLTGSVGPQRSRTLDEGARACVEELKRVGCKHVRHITVRGEPQHIQELVTNASNDNECDAIVLIGGTGIGPYDHVCEALNALFDRRMEGFGEAYRRLLRGDRGVHAMLARATAGVYNKVLVFALSGAPDEVRLATEVLIGPTIADAFDLAAGVTLGTTRPG
jgi:molybdopterin adenylyltransferase